MKKTVIFIAVSIITVFAYQGCALFTCGTDETLNLCEQILRNPDSLDSIANNEDIARFSEQQRTHFQKLKLLIRENFSKGFYKQSCKIEEHGFLVYEYYGDFYNYPITQKKERAYLNFGFSNKSNKWILFNIIDYNPDTNNPYPPGHGNMIGK